MICGKRCKLCIGTGFVLRCHIRIHHIVVIILLCVLLYYYCYIHHSQGLESLNVSQMLHVRNTAFFSTCNDEYLRYSVTSLLSIRQYLPSASLYIISKYISDDNRSLLEKLNISLIVVDLSNLFPKTWLYPLECFYLFAGPQFLLKRGFEYSVYIDGDILCLTNPLEFLPRNLSGLAGVSMGLCKNIFPKEQLETIQKLFKISTFTIETQPRIQSGVVFFNNKKMESLDFLAAASDSFLKCLNYGVPRKGDDSLLALLQLTKLKDYCFYLHRGYNYICSRFGQIDGNIVFMHFANKENKPWNNDYLNSSLNNVWIHYIKQYQQILRLCCSNETKW